MACYTRTTNAARITEAKWRCLDTLRWFMLAERRGVRLPLGENTGELGKLVKWFLRVSDGGRIGVYPPGR